MKLVSLMILLNVISIQAMQKGNEVWRKVDECPAGKRLVQMQKKGKDEYRLVVTLDDKKKLTFNIATREFLDVVRLLKAEKAKL